MNVGYALPRLRRSWLALFALANAGSGPVGTASTAGDQLQPRRRMEGAHQQVHRTIPPSGDAACAAAQSISGGPPPRTPVSSSIIAKVGAAARHTQSAAPTAAAFPLPVPASAVSRGLAIIISRPVSDVFIVFRLPMHSHLPSASILIVPAYPLHREAEAVLIAAFGHKVEELVGTIDHVNAPPVARISVEHLASLVLVEDTDSRFVRCINRPNCIVVVRLAPGDLFGRERHVIVEIELASIGRDPWEAPAHALLVRFDLGQRSARNGCKCHIAMIEMDRDSIEIVGPERARLAAFLPIG